MPILFDTHMHTNFSTDSATPMENQVAQAKKNGLSGICFTDHMDYEFPPEEIDIPFEGVPFTFNIADYITKIRHLRRLEPDFRIYTGVECGMKATPSVLEKNKKLVEDYDEWDYIIGSVHLVEDKDPYYPDLWESKSPQPLILNYFETILSCLSVYANFDSLGHMDYIVRYAPDSFSYEPKDYQDITDAILKLMVRKDIALELNASGFFSSGRQMNPHPYILQRYRELGGEMVTVGSDAHAPERISRRFSDIEKIMKKTGFYQYVTFEKRRPVFHNL